MITHKEQIINYFKSGIRETKDFKIGIEHEKFLFDQNKNQLSINLKLISSNEMMKINEEFREKRTDTNVLSFPADGEIQKISGELGDIAISIPYVQTESKNLNRDLDDHMMHLLAHGILHLLGFDHQEDQDANIMEAQEIKYLEFFKIANPYLL